LGLPGQRSPFRVSFGSVQEQHSIRDQFGHISSDPVLLVAPCSISAANEHSTSGREVVTTGLRLRVESEDGVGLDVSLILSALIFPLLVYEHAEARDRYSVRLCVRGYRIGG